MKPEELIYENEVVEAGIPDVNRRDFLKLGAGLFVFMAVETSPAFQEPQRLPGGRPGYPTDFNAYLRIAPDGRITCLVGKVELGQGSKTALAQLLAEELDVPLDSVDMVMGDTDVCPWDMGTFGSLSIRQFGPVLKAAAAEARAVLLAMAAERLQTPVESLQVKDAAVVHPAGRLTYSELVQGKRIERHVDKPVLKPVSAYKVVGQSPRRKDALEKVTGKAKYAGDIRLPGMLHARLVRPPAHGATLKNAETSAAENLPGVRVLRDGDFVAVLHEHRDAADQALALVKAQYDPAAPGPDDKTIFDHLLKHAPEPRVLNEAGNLGEGEKLAKTLVEETYFNSYVAHSPMEPHSATAMVEGDKITVWASTQAPFSVKTQVAQALRTAPENVRIITPYVGGGFGGKSAARQAAEAARLAKLAGKPVQVIWDRDEEFFFDTFRPAAAVKIRSGLTGDNKIPLWDFTVYCAGSREAQQFYDIPHQRTRSAGEWGGGNPAGLHPFGIGPWRAPSVNTNTFARESHIDILAHRAGMDPIAFRLAHLSDKRTRRVLDAAVKQFGWKAAKTPSGRGFGVACAHYLGTHVATIAEVAVDKGTGHVQVKRVVCAQDQGVTVSPVGSRQQIEGSIMMGLGYALTEEVRFKDGTVLDRNFDSYELPRFSWMPQIESVLIENPDDAATGCGEPPIVTIGAVIANAIYDAVGARLFQLPMTPARVKEAVKRA